MEDAHLVTRQTDLRALEAALLEAIVSRDRPTLASLLDEDFVITTAGWMVQPAGKVEWVQQVLDQHVLHEFSIDAIDERTIEGVCVALVLSTQTVTWRGRRQTLRLRYTDLWRPSERRWRLAVRHATMVPVSPD